MGNKRGATESVTLSELSDGEGSMKRVAEGPKKARKSTTRPLLKDVAKKKIAYANDELGKLAFETSSSLYSAAGSSTVSPAIWKLFASDFQGAGRLNVDLDKLPHPAGKLLHQIQQHGVPITLLSEPWPEARLLETLERGPHKSARDSIDFVWQEMADFQRKSYWIVLPFEQIRHLPGLRLSPLGAVPQRNRQPRLINDLTFSGINSETRRDAPHESMQFGKALERILGLIANANPNFGPVWLSKIDLSDGFYRIPIDASQALSLACMVPCLGHETPLVAIPLSLPMGWVESPPWFCALTETIADVANARTHFKRLPSHRLEKLAMESGEEEPPIRPIQPSPTF